MALKIYLKRKNLFTFFIFLFTFSSFTTAQYAEFDAEYHPAAMLIRNARFLLQEKNQTPEHFTAAIGLLEKASYFEPENPNIFRMLSFLYQETGDYSSRTQALSRLVKLAPNDQVAALEYQRDLLNTRNQSSGDRMIQYKTWKEKIEKYFKKTDGNTRVSGAEIFSRLMNDGAILARQRGELELWDTFIGTATLLDPHWEEVASLNIGRDLLKQYESNQTIEKTLNEVSLCSSLLISNPSNPDHAMRLADVYLKNYAYSPASRWIGMAVSGMAIDSQAQTRGDLLIENLVNIDDLAIEKLALAHWASGHPDKALDVLHERQEVVNALHKDEFKSFYEEKYGISPPIGDRTKWRYPIEHALSRLRALIDPDWPANQPTRDPFLRGIKSIEHVVLSYKELLKNLSEELKQEELNFKTVLNKDINHNDKVGFENRIKELKVKYKLKKTEAAFWVLFLGWRDYISPNVSESTQEKIKTTVRDSLAHARVWIDESKEDVEVHGSEVQNLLELMYQWRDLQYCEDLLRGDTDTVFSSECVGAGQNTNRQLEKIYQEVINFGAALNQSSLIYRTCLAVQARMALDRAKIHPSVGNFFPKEVETMGSELRLLKDVCVEFRKKQQGMHHLSIWAKRKLATVLKKEKYDLDKNQYDLVNQLEGFDKSLPENLHNFLECQIDLLR